MSITIDEIDNKVREKEGTSKATPITMKGLNDRIDNLIATGKDWAIVGIVSSNTGTASNDTPIYPIPSNLLNYNFAVICVYNLIAENTYAKGAVIEFNSSTINNFNLIPSGEQRRYINFDFKKVGSNITVTSSDESMGIYLPYKKNSTIKVLFYK